MYTFIGERIKKIRESLGISQKNLGASLGLSDKAISSYESGRTLPPIEILFKIAKEFNKPVTYFLEDDNNIPLSSKIEELEAQVESLLNEVKSLRVIVQNSPSSNNHLTPPNMPTF